MAACALAQDQGPMNTPRINSTYYVGSLNGLQFYPTIQSAVTDACAISNKSVVDIPASYTGVDPISGVSGGCTNAVIVDEHNGLPTICYTWQTSAYSSSGVSCAGGGGGGGTLSISSGGTGATTAPAALSNLGALSSANPAWTGQMTKGTPGYTNTADMFLQSPLNNVMGINIQTTSTGNTAVAQFAVSNSASGTYAGNGQFGINGTGWTPGYGNIGSVGGVYLQSKSVPIAIGSFASGDFDLVSNNVKMIHFPSSSTMMQFPTMTAASGQTSQLRIDANGTVSSFPDGMVAVTNDGCPSNAAQVINGVLGTCSAGTPTLNDTVINNAWALGGISKLPTALQLGGGLIEVDGNLQATMPSMEVHGGGWGRYTPNTTTLAVMSTTKDGIQVNCQNSSYAHGTECEYMPSFFDLNIRAKGTGGSSGTGLNVIANTAAPHYTGDEMQINRVMIDGFANPLYVSGTASVHIYDMTIVGNAPNSANPTTTYAAQFWGPGMNDVIVEKMNIGCGGTSIVPGNAGYSLAGALYVNSGDGMKLHIGDVTFCGTGVTWGPVAGATGPNGEVWIGDPEGVAGSLVIQQNGSVGVHWENDQQLTSTIAPLMRNSSVNLMTIYAPPIYTPGVATNIPTITSGTPTGSGSLTCATCYVVITATNLAGETLPSAVAGPFAVSSGTLPLVWPIFPAATCYNVYLGTTATVSAMQLVQHDSATCTKTGMQSVGYTITGTEVMGAAPPTVATFTYPLGLVTTSTGKIKVIGPPILQTGLLTTGTMISDWNGQYYSAYSEPFDYPGTTCPAASLYRRGQTIRAVKGNAANSTDIECKYFNTGVGVGTANITTGTVGSGAVVLASGIQGTDTNVLTSGTVSGTASPLCTDALGGATTVGCSAGTVITATPPWLMYLGNGADGANTSASGNMYGDRYFTNFTVPYGNTVTVNNSAGLTIHATGTCTIAGTINANAAGSQYGYGGGPGGGGGGGTAAGTAGGASLLLPGTSVTLSAGGTAGALTGGAGGTSSALNSYAQRLIFGANATEGQFLNGGYGGAGGSTGGANGIPGNGVTLICAALTGTDGSHTGIINVSGGAGGNAAASNTGSGGGGGGGVVLLSSHTAVGTWPTVYVAGGGGALATVPQAIGYGGSCTSPPKATLGVTAGALSGVCTVAQAGAGCGTGAGLTWVVQGGGGTLGTGTVNPTWSGGALASCTTTAGSSSGYTAATYTTSGAGGDGALGFSKQCTWDTGCV